MSPCKAHEQDERGNGGDRLHTVEDCITKEPDHAEHHEGGEQPEEAKKDDVIDADFKDVSDDKKKSA